MNDTVLGNALKEAGVTPESVAQPEKKAPRLQRDKKRWHKDEDDLLLHMHKTGVHKHTMSAALGRSVKSIDLRLYKTKDKPSPLKIVGHPIVTKTAIRKPRGPYKTAKQKAHKAARIKSLQKAQAVRMANIKARREAVAAAAGKPAIIETGLTVSNVVPPTPKLSAEPNTPVLTQETWAIIVLGLLFIGVIICHFQGLI